MNLSFAYRLLKNIYLELVDDIIKGKDLPTAEEKAMEFMEKLNLSPQNLKK